MTARHRTALSALAAGLVAALMPWQPAAAATVQCGDVLIADTVLTADLICGPGSDGLIIGADGVTLDLRGHTISGPGPAATNWSGVRVARQAGVTIKRGTITGFDAGVVLDEASHNLVTGLVVRANERGINLAGGTGHTIEKNFAYDSHLDGIRLGLTSSSLISKNVVADNVFGIGVANGAAGNVVEKNTVADNRGFGIALFANASNTVVEKNDVTGTWGHGIQVNSDTAGSLLSKNYVVLSGLDGIRVDSPFTTITKNTANENAQLGINAPGAGDGGGNKASGNGDPAQCVGVACK